MAGKLDKKVSNWIPTPLFTIHQSNHFAAWLKDLADQTARALVIKRIRSAQQGNFGDCGSVGGGVCELRIHHGPGYRVYFARNGAAMHVLPCGGDKKTQQRDIARAKRMAKDLKEPGE